MANSIQISEFKLEQFNVCPHASVITSGGYTGSTILIMALRGQSHEQLIIDILNTYDSTILANSVIVSNLNKCSSLYRKAFPTTHLMETIDGEYLNKLKIRAGLVNNPGILVLDWCLTGKYFEVLEELVLNHRAYQMSIIIAIQIPFIGLTPRIVSNMDYTFVAKYSQYHARYKLHTMYEKYMSTTTDFDKTYNECTKDDGYMVISSNSVSRYKSPNLSLDAEFEDMMGDINDKIDQGHYILLPGGITEEVNEEIESNEEIKSNEEANEEIESNEEANEESNEGAIEEVIEEPIEEPPNQTSSDTIESLLADLINEFNNNIYVALEGGDKIVIKRYPLEDLHKHAAILIIGKRR